MATSWRGRNSPSTSQERTIASLRLWAHAWALELTHFLESTTSKYTIPHNRMHMSYLHILVLPSPAPAAGLALGDTNLLFCFWESNYILCSGWMAVVLDFEMVNHLSTASSQRVWSATPSLKGVVQQPQLLRFCFLLHLLVILSNNSSNVNSLKGAQFKSFGSGFWTKLIKSPFIVRIISVFTFQ